jgi:hypothetical protein
MGGPTFADFLVDLATERASGELVVESRHPSVTVEVVDGRVRGIDLSRLVDLCALGHGSFRWSPGSRGGQGISLDPRRAVFVWEARCLEAAGRGALDVHAGQHLERFVLCHPDQRAVVDGLDPDLDALVAAAAQRAVPLGEFRGSASLGSDRTTVLCLAAARAGLMSLAAGPMDSAAEGLAVSRLDRWLGLMRSSTLPPGQPVFATPADYEKARQDAEWMFGQADLWPANDDVQELRGRVWSLLQQGFDALRDPDGRAQLRGRLDPRWMQWEALVEGAWVRRAGKPSERPWEMLAEAGLLPPDAAAWEAP